MPVRTVGEQAFRIRELRVRFFRADMMFKPSPEVADEYLKSVVNTAGNDSGSAAVPDVLTALRNGVTPLEYAGSPRQPAGFLSLCTGSQGSTDFLQGG